MSASPIRVHVPVFRECDPSVVYGVFDTLWASGRMWNPMHGRAAEDPNFEPRLVGAEAGALDLITGVTIVLQESIGEVCNTDIVFVPNVLVDSADALGQLDAGIVDWIRQMHDNGAQIYAACGGPLVLAAAGLLDGRKTTTHWGYADLMRRAFPEVEVHENRILVEAAPGSRIVCSGGASSWQDLALYLIARHVGVREAMRIAKLFLYQWHHDGQLPYASLIRGMQHADGLISPLQEWIAGNYDRRDAVAELVRRSGLAKRTFDRRFKAATGYAPLAYVQSLRIEEARQMLETTSLPVEAVAFEVGYEDLRHFRQLFQRLVGITPGAYRRKLSPPIRPEGLSPSQQPARDWKAAATIGTAIPAVSKPLVAATARASRIRG